MNIPWRAYRGDKKYLAPALAVALVALGTLFTLAFRDYTILTVNGEHVSVRRFTLNVRAARAYYKNAGATYRLAGEQGAPAGRAERPDDKELKAQVLTQLVEGVLVDAGARAEAGDALDALTEEKIAQYRNDAGLAEAADSLYGMSADEFTEEVLKPQAKYDILRGRLFLKGASFKEWMDEARRSADVRIFSEDFTWNGAQVAPRD